MIRDKENPNKNLSKWSSIRNSANNKLIYPIKTCSKIINSSKSSRKNPQMNLKTHNNMIFKLL